MQKLLLCWLLIWGTSSWAQKPEAIKAYNRGLEHYNAQAYRAAIPYFELAIEKDPSFYYALRTLIVCHESLGEIAATIPLYQSAIELMPSDRSLCYNLALSYLELKQHNNARLYLKRALTIDPTYLKASKRLDEVEVYLAKQGQAIAPAAEQTAPTEENYYSQALKAYKKADYEACLSALAQYSGRSPQPDFYYLKAIALQELGHKEEAVEVYEMVLELDDQYFNANLNLAKLFYNEGDFEAAIPLFETAYAQRKKDLTLLYALAKAHYFNKDYEAALPYLEAYTKQRATEGNAWRLLGKSYQRLGKGRQAAKALDLAQKYGADEEIIAQDIESVIAAYGKRASALSKEGKHSAAIAVLEEGIEAHPTVANLHFNLGLNYLKIGQVEQAENAFKLAIKYQKGFGKAYQALGSIAYDREAYKEAGAYYLAAVEAGKQDEVVYYKLGSCWFRLNQYQKAADAFSNAIAQNNQEKRYHFALGLSQTYLDQHYAAMRAFKAALALDEGYLEAHYQLCVSYMRVQDYKTCIEEAERLLKKDPNYAQAYLVLGHAHKQLGNYVLAEKLQKRAQAMDPTLKQPNWPTKN